MLKQVFTTLGLAAIVAPAMGAEWMTDYDAATAKAAKEGKAVLINFTGSDWCGYCIRMKRQIFDTPEFADYVKDKFVLLEIDLPRRKQLEPAVKEKREQLCRDFEVRGFPTILAISSTGEVLGGFTGAQPTMEGVAIYLDNALARKQMLEAARKLEGEARAKALMEVYKDYPKNFKTAAAKLRSEISACDPNDTTGLKKQAEADDQMLALQQELSYCGRDYGRMTEVYDKFIAEAHPLNKEKFMERKRDHVVFPCVNLMLRNAKTVEDVNKARDYVLQEAETSYPEHMKAAMIEALKKQFADPEALLKKLNKR